MKKTALVVVIMIFFFASMSGCFGESNNRLLEVIPSPGGDHVAYVFVRDLGATTRESYQLSILRKGETLGDQIGNTFRSYSGFAVVWDGATTVTVTYPQNAEVFAQNSSVKGVHVNYVITVVLPESK